MEKLEFPYIAVGNVKWCTALESSLAIPQAMKHSVTMYDPAIPFLGIYQREIKTPSHKNVYTTVHSRLFIIIRKKKETQMSINDKWINKIWCTHTMPYYLAIKKNGVLIHVQLDENLENM